MPERAGMPDDGTVLPWLRQAGLFPELIELERERLQIKVERERLKLEREQARGHHRHQTPHAPPPHTRARDGYRPQDKAFREYASARRRFVEWEDAVRALGEAVTPAGLQVHAGAPHPRTQAHIMAFLGLRYPQDWPPSTWPAASVRDK